MKEQLIHVLGLMGVPDSDFVYALTALALIGVVSVLVHVLLHRIILRFIDRKLPEIAVPSGPASPDQADQPWWVVLFSHHIFTRLGLAFQGVVVYTLARILLEADSGLMQLLEVLSQLWIILFTLLVVFSVLDALGDLARAMPLASRLPLRGIFQGIKLLCAIIATIFGVALLIGKSPVILFSGLGAMTAILLLIFKDPILGLVAGIQLSANDMLRVNDWLEMPNYGADGDVVDISLTTVKVRNWDQTITSIPSYALISDSFKNWRNIQKAGGRRIKRAVHIDAMSVRFATGEDLDRLRRADLLSEYIETKVAEIETYNQAHGVDQRSPVNGRRLTNLGIFRAYLVAYLEANEHINHDLTYMVRQLAAGADGIPLEIYGFANDIRWVWYETIQSDIFDHVFAVIPEFGLRLHQSPTGHDIRELGKSLRSEMGS